MLKHDNGNGGSTRLVQPPSGGCVLKPHRFADFGALHFQPPSGGCVLKQYEKGDEVPAEFPAAFRRLCVETYMIQHFLQCSVPSRLQAAVC